MRKTLKILVISDGTGKTAKEILRAVSTQFKNDDIVYTTKKNITNPSDVQNIFLEAALHHDLVVYTVVKPEIKQSIIKAAELHQVDTIDIMGPLIETFTQKFKMTPDFSSGLSNGIGEDYYRRISAIEFALNHDDGKNLKNLDTADIVLIGVSRTSKTPLSIFLSLEGMKVINIPIKLNEDLPKEVYSIDQKKVIAVTINPEILKDIRKYRVDVKREKKSGEYTNIDKITREMFWAETLFDKNPIWPKFDITNKSLEEVASDIHKLLEIRKQNELKHSLRFSSPKKNS